MRVLVTGANGFIGSALVKKLLAAGREVTCLTHRSQERLKGLNVRVVQGDLAEACDLSKALDGVETVFHLAARASDWGPRKVFFRVNTEGTRNILEAACQARARRFVLLSSLAIHRFTGYVDADESTPADQDKYAYSASKAAAERLVLAARDAGRIETTIVRPGAVVLGPEDTTAFIFMAPLLSSGRWTHVRGGRPLLCYSYVENLADGLIMAGTSSQGAGETFIITDDLRLSWADYIHALISAFGVRERTFSFPIPLARTAGWAAEMLFRLFRSKNPPPITDYRTALVSRDFHFSCEKAKEQLSYRPLVSFDEGIRNTVAWYLDWRRKARDR